MEYGATETVSALTRNCGLCTERCAFPSSLGFQSWPVPLPPTTQIYQHPNNMTAGVARIKHQIQESAGGGICDFAFPKCISVDIGP